MAPRGPRREKGKPAADLSGRAHLSRSRHRPSGTSAVGSAVAIDSLHIGDNHDVSMTKPARASKIAECRRRGTPSSGDGEGHGGGGDDQDGDGGREHWDAGGEPAHEPIAAGPDGSPPRRQGRHRWSWLDRHRVALLDASARETPTTLRLRGAVSSLAYSAALARNAAMSMMKPEANQTTSMGMMEIMGASTGRVEGKQRY